MELSEKVLRKERVFQGRVFTTEVWDVELSDGSLSRREIVCHPGGAAIIPVDHEGNVYMIRQFRAPFLQIMLEIPAGKLEQGEDPKEAAIRELSEETGLSAKTVTELGTVYPTPGYCQEKLHLYMATELTVGEDHPDDGEFLSVEKIPLSQLVEMAETGELKDAKTTIAVLRADRKLRELSHG